MINKILVAVDHSDQNKSVFNSALSLAKTTGANLMLLHVLSEDEPDYPVLPTYAYYPQVDDLEYEVYQGKLAEYEKWGLDLLQNLAKEAREQEVETEYAQLTGNPKRSICELATSWSADVIVVGSRGLKGLKEMFLGSVSNYVTHHAPCSVLIVRSAIDDESNESNLEPFPSEAKPTTNNQEPTTNPGK